MSKDEALRQIIESQRDMLAGWKYIRDSHGDLYGVGWDRAQEKAEAAIAAAQAALAEQPAAPQMLTDAEIDKLIESVGMAPYGVLKLHPSKRLQYQMLSRAILARAIPPGCVVVKDEPVAWLVVRYEGGHETLEEVDKRTHGAFPVYARQGAPK